MTEPEFFICNKWRNKYYFFTSIIGIPVRIESVSFSLVFYLTTGIIQRLLEITRNKKKKHDKIIMLAKSKSNIIETFQQMKEIVGNIKSNGEKDELGENSKNNGKNIEITQISENIVIIIIIVVVVVVVIVIIIIIIIIIFNFVLHI